MRKIVLSIMLTLAMVLTMIPVMGSVAYAADKAVITSIEGTSNISEVLVLGQGLKNPTFTITAGSPAEYNDAGIMNWYKKENGSWVRCQWNDTFTGGEYRLICMFGVYGTDFNEYTLDDNVTLKLDGAAWEINKAPITNTEDFFPYCYMEVVSPVYNVAEPISNAKDFDIFFEGDTTTYKYNGKVIKPIVYINNDKIHEALEQNVDYKVTFPSGMKDVGSYTVTIEGIGKYTGTVTKTYKIIPATPSIKSLTSGTKKLTVKMTTKPSSKGATTYQIYYKQKGTSSWKKTTTTAQSKTIKGLKKGKQYYVKVRAYKKVDTEIYYGAWSKAKLSKKI